MTDYIAELLILDPMDRPAHMRLLDRFLADKPDLTKDIAEWGADVIVAVDSGLVDDAELAVFEDSGRHRTPIVTL